MLYATPFPDTFTLPCLTCCSFFLFLGSIEMFSSVKKLFGLGSLTSQTSSGSVCDMS